MKNTLKTVVAIALAAAEFAATAMPTKRQLAEAQQIVKDLTADDIRALKAKQKTAREVAAKHLDLAAKADTEAGKYLLLDGAFRLYARGGDYNAAADVLQRMKKDISDVSPELMVELVDGEMRHVAYSKAPKVHAIYSEAKHTIKYRKRLAAVEAEVEKRGTSKSFRQLAECHVHLGNWKKALEVFARARVPVAKWELDPKSVSDCDAFKAAEYWWNYEAEETEPFRAHAVALYRIALDGGLVTGLHSEVVKKRIAEIEALKMPKSPLALTAGGRLYCVIDLSAGPNATKYPVSYLAAEPKGGWTDEYKTTKLVLRYIAPETQTNDTHRVKAPFYIGVFEVTQKQYELVTGVNPACHKGGNRPVENVSWKTVRDSFMANIRNRTGLKGFDLPYARQWVYASRAGTSTYLNTGKEKNAANIAAVGRTAANRRKGATAVVGSYQPNAWGLYDMHGNVLEWCLDGGRGKHLAYGGSWRHGIWTSSTGGSYGVTFSFDALGFRLVLHRGWDGNDLQ